jgi:hypothetical protein
MTDRALIPGELRGYRQFALRDDGLYPLVHTASGAWDSHETTAVCATGEDHEPPARDCRCGLYAFYLPGSATVALGAANAVVKARGRTVLGDRGYRAARARIEAVALPAYVRLTPGGTAKAQRMLAERYPGARVYTSTRRMLADHPPDDVRALGITPPLDQSRRYRAIAVTLWASFVVAFYSLAAVPRDALADNAHRWWLALLVGIVGWHAALVWLVSRLMAEQTAGAAGFRASEDDGPASG